MATGSQGPEMRRRLETGQENDHAIAGSSRRGSRDKRRTRARARSPAAAGSARAEDSRRRVRAAQPRSHHPARPEGGGRCSADSGVRHVVRSCRGPRRSRVGRAFCRFLIRVLRSPRRRQPVLPGAIRIAREIPAGPRGRRAVMPCPDFASCPIQCGRFAARHMPALVGRGWRNAQGVRCLAHWVRVRGIPGTGTVPASFGPRWTGRARNPCGTVHSDVARHPTQVLRRLRRVSSTAPAAGGGTGAIACLAVALAKASRTTTFPA